MATVTDDTGAITKTTVVDLTVCAESHLFCTATDLIGRIQGLVQVRTQG